MKIKYLFFGALLCIISCAKDDTLTRNQPVIVSYLMPGKIPVVKISQLSTVYETESEDVDSLNIEFSVNSGLDYLISKGSGKYIGDSSCIAFAGDTCSIRFTWCDSVVTATTIIPGKPQGFIASGHSIAIEPFDPGSGSTGYIPDPIVLSWQNPGNDYHLVVVKNIEYYPGSINSGGGRNMAFQNRPDQDTVFELGFRDFSYYGTHKVILFRLNPECVSLFDFHGDNTQDISSQPVNIKNGLGVFTGVNADTLLVEVSAY